MKNKVHPEQLTYALAVTVYHHPRFIRLAPPNWFEVFPNYLLPATSLRELYKSKMEGKLMYNSNKHKQFINES